MQQPGACTPPAPGCRIHANERASLPARLRRNRYEDKSNGTIQDHSARVTAPQPLGSLLIFCVPVQPSCGTYSVPGQG